jgi:general stress protein YciG
LLEKKGKITCAEAGRLGGLKTSATHSSEFYRKIGEKGGSAVKAKRGIEFYSIIGQKGGSQRAKQHTGSGEAEGKTSVEEAGHRGGSTKRRRAHKQV